jgi:hypothetical protein
MTTRGPNSTVTVGRQESRRDPGNSPAGHQGTTLLFVDHGIYKLGLVPLSLIPAGWYSISMILVINPKEVVSFA